MNCLEYIWYDNDKLKTKNRYLRNVSENDIISHDNLNFNFMLNNPFIPNGVFIFCDKDESYRYELYELINSDSVEIEKYKMNMNFTYEFGLKDKCPNTWFLELVGYYFTLLNVNIVESTINDKNKYSIKFEYTDVLSALDTIMVIRYMLDRIGSYYNYTIIDTEIMFETFKFNLENPYLFFKGVLNGAEGVN